MFSLRTPLGRTLAFLAAAFCLLAPSAHAQSSGSIVGRVYNPTTQEYVRDAEVEVEGTALKTNTEVGGLFQLFNVPAGEVRMVVRYSGYTTQTLTVTVGAGQTATRDVELVPVRTPARGAAAGEAVELTAFVVSSEREGNAESTPSGNSHGGGPRKTAMAGVSAGPEVSRGAYIGTANARHDLSHEPQVAPPSEGAEAATRRA